jgi:hypothetical protein
MNSNISRRGFVSLAAAAGVSPWAFAGGSARIRPLAGAPELGGVLPGWRKGELDLHFIHTGRGESMFYRFPDGTSMVNDVGDLWRENERHLIPWFPRKDLLAGECVARYVKRELGVAYVDYIALSHWHNDHAGALRCGTKKAADGREVCGIPLFNEYVGVGKFFDHQYPVVRDCRGRDEDCKRMIEEWVAAKKIVRESFRVGALNQIKLVHDTAARFAGKFSVRNVCANAVCWTGKGEEARDYGAEHLRATGKTVMPNENTLSMGFVVQYGKFRYWAGGDVSKSLTGADGKSFNFEDLVGRVVGPVTVCKTNHHAFRDAMTETFVRETRAVAYVTAVWCPRHVQDCNMRHMSSRALYPGERMVFPTYLPAWPKSEWPHAPWWGDVYPSAGANIVVRVAEGGDTFRIYATDAASENPVVIGVWEGIA